MMTVRYHDQGEGSSALALSLESGGDPVTLLKQLILWLLGFQKQSIFLGKNDGSEGCLSIQQEIEDRTPYVVVVRKEATPFSCP